MEARLREEEARARDPVGGLPERPRLRLGCCWFEGADGLVVHSVRGAFRVPPSHVEAMRTIFARLDGRHDYEAVLGAVPTDQIGSHMDVPTRTPRRETGDLSCNTGLTSTAM
jgi:hypothetical protein